MYLLYFLNIGSEVMVLLFHYCVCVGLVLIVSSLMR